MKQITLEQYHSELRAQDVPRNDLAMICPACGGVQSGRDFIDAGETEWETIETYLGFSCVGRFMKAGPPPKDKAPENRCNWTLGGLFKIHELEVLIDENGKTVRHPRFLLATPEQAKAHAMVKGGGTL